MKLLLRALCNYNGLLHEPAGGIEEKGKGGVLQARNEEPAAPQ